MNGPKLREVPTPDGMKYIVDEKAEIKAQEWYVNNGVIFLADEYLDESNHPNVNSNNHKVIAQPLESNLPGIPYYRIEEGETMFDKMLKAIGDNIIVNGGSAEYSASAKACADIAKGKGEFTEADARKIFDAGGQAQLFSEGSPDYGFDSDFNNIISSIRTREVEIDYVMEKTCSRTEWECNCGIDGSTCDSIAFVPATYTEHGKTYIKFKVTYKQPE